MYGFDLSGLGKIEGIFKLELVGEKGISMIICFDW